MPLSKEQILTLTCMKEVGVKGIGPQKIFAIGAVITKYNLEINSYENLAKWMSKMKGKAIPKVTLANLNAASRVAQKIIEASNRVGIGLVGFFDDDFPAMLRNTVNEEGKTDPPLLLWHRGDLSITQLPGLDILS